MPFNTSISVKTFAFFIKLSTILACLTGFDLYYLKLTIFYKVSPLFVLLFLKELIRVTKATFKMCPGADPFKQFLTINLSYAHFRALLLVEIL